MASIKRDCFSMPQDEHDMIQNLIYRLARRGIVANKSMVIRMGIKTLNEMKAAELVESSKMVDKLKVGRPTKYQRYVGKKNV